ncbi:MAG TPA: redoxin domain-containing protein [Saprospiraceae bacterium]|nr:redoxin domain-containing protein [Saprospiraceae bacterium]HMQ85869.1 redoxin domain-containing protein [Saprospiraceae bacterium]
MSVSIGDKAPSFSLYATDKSQIDLSQFHGQNVVILFFPMAFTGVCTAELCSMRDDIATYSGLNAQILAISVDSPFSLGKFKSDQNLNFPLLSDFNKEVSRAYGVLYEEFVLGLRGVAKRSAFVIDKEGIVRYAEILESAGDLPNFEAVRATLAQLN